jgi:hypothetical protein
MSTARHTAAQIITTRSLKDSPKTSRLPTEPTEYPGLPSDLARRGEVEDAIDRQDVKAQEEERV